MSRFRWVFFITMQLVFAVGALMFASYERGRRVGQSEFRGIATDALDAAKVAQAAFNEERKVCVEMVNERAKSQMELMEAFCRERVTGCTRVEALIRHPDGSYECRCKP